MLQKWAYQRRLIKYWNNDRDSHSKSAQALLGLTIDTIGSHQKDVTRGAGQVSLSDGNFLITAGYSASAFAFCEARLGTSPSGNRHSRCLSNGSFRSLPNVNSRSSR